ncbi:hypothetical protein BH11PLA2_BH11PLA2_48880 [soil metagenome]
MPTIVATSDLHRFLPEIEPCDLLLIAGDLCGPSDLPRQQAWLEGPFAQWLSQVPAVEVVGIAGNHDWIFERAANRVPRLHWHYLQDCGIELFGLKIYGSPWQPRFCDWAFNADEPELDRWFRSIPDDTDILLTHGPAFCVGDRCVYGHLAGSPLLLEHIQRVRPKLHVFGQIHKGYGSYRIGETVSANVSHVDLDDRPVNPPMMWEF